MTLPLLLHQTSAQLLNDGVQLSIETVGAIWTQTVWQCWCCWQLRTTVGWSKSNIAITNEVRKNEKEKETRKKGHWRKIEQDRQCTYEYRDIEARSCNHCCSGKAIKYYIYWVCVGRLACAILSSGVCPDLPYFSTLSHKRHDFRKEMVI